MGWSGIKDYGWGGKYRSPEKDAEYRSRQKGVPHKRAWTKDKCILELEFILFQLKTILIENSKIEIGNPSKLKRETVRDLNTMMNRILDFMKYLYPPVQQNVNVNIDVDLDNYAERVRKRMVEKYGIVVEEKKEKEEEEEEVEVENE